jgi:hypothetical protein
MLLNQNNNIINVFLFNKYLKNIFLIKVKPKCRYLSLESKNNFLKNVDRSSAETKVSGLIQETKIFNEEMVII